MKSNLGRIFLLVFTLTLVSESVCAKALYELGSGFSFLTFKETHTGQSSKDVEFTQKSLLFKGAYRLEILGKWLTFNSELKAIAPSIGSSDSNYSVKVYDANNFFFLTIPSKPIKLHLTFEYYYHKMQTSSQDFGYDTMSGQRYSIVLNMVNRSKRIKFEFRYPWFNEVSGRKEMFADLYLNLTPVGGENFFFSSVQYLKLGWHSETTTFGTTLPIEIKVSTITLSWVRSW